LYFVLGGTIVFLTLVVVPSAVKTVRLAWINRNTENSSLEDEYNITFEAIKDQYATASEIEDVYSSISSDK
jgi:hypothetical protein